MKADNMITAHCRSGHEVGCSIAVHDPRGFSRRSTKELLFPVNEQPKHNGLPVNATSQTATLSGSLSDSRLVRRSAALPVSYINDGPTLKSNATSIRSRMSSTKRLRSRRPNAEQIHSQSLLRSSSNHSSSSRRNSPYSSFLKDESGFSREEVSPVGSTAESHSVQFSSISQSRARNSFGSSPVGSGTVHSASRRLGQENEYQNRQLGRSLPRLSLRIEHDMEHEKSHQVLEATELVPVHTGGQNISSSNHGHSWTAPPMESGQLITITVSQGEDAEFSTIQKAVDSVPEHNTQRIVIRIHAGTYR